MWHMSAINKCITSAATTGLFFGMGVGGSEDPLLRLDSLSKPAAFLSVSFSIGWPTLQSLRSSKSRQSGRERYAGCFWRLDGD